MLRKPKRIGINCRWTLELKHFQSGLQTYINANLKSRKLPSFYSSRKDKLYCSSNKSAADDLFAQMHESMAKYSTINSSATVNGFEHVVKREGLGVVIANIGSKINFPLILGALLLGNAVVVVMEKDSADIKNLTKFLPIGLLNCLTIPTVENLPKIIFLHAASNYMKVQGSLDDLNDWDAILRRCTVSKNIWTSVGDSI